jgi:PAS domain S-box-containing protein
MDYGWIAALGTAIVAIVGLWYTKRREVRQDEITVLNESIKELRADRDAMKTDLRTKDLEVGKLKDDNTACLIAQEMLKGKVVALEAAVQLARQERVEFQRVMITATLDGVITDASDEVRTMLGWRPAELVGKNVDVVVPGEYRERHHEAFARAKADGHVRPPDILIRGCALHRNSSRIPVIVSITGRQDNSRYLVTAQLFNYDLDAMIGGPGQ